MYDPRVMLLKYPHSAILSATVRVHVRYSSLFFHWNLHQKSNYSYQKGFKKILFTKFSNELNSSIRYNLTIILATLIFWLTPLIPFEEWRLFYCLFLSEWLTFYPLNEMPTKSCSLSCSFKVQKRRREEIPNQFS